MKRNYAYSYSTKQMHKAAIAFILQMRMPTLECTERAKTPLHSSRQSEIHFAVSTLTNTTQFQ